MSRNQFEDLLQKDLTKLFADTLSSNPGINKRDAMQKAAETMLKNNPFMPPKEGCPINDLPNELLAHIFQVGVDVAEEEDEWDEEGDEEDDVYDFEDLDSDWETEDEDDMMSGMPGGLKKKSKGKEKEKPGDKDKEKQEEEDEQEKEKKEEAIRKMPFQMLASHVCKHWREVALETPTLWTSMNFCFGSSIESAKVWVERSKSQPLDITLDCSVAAELIVEDDELSDDDDGGDESDDDQVMEDANHNNGNNTPAATGDDPHSLSSDGLPGLSQDEIREFLDIIIPHVDRWKSFRLVASHYDKIYPVLERLSQCPSASSLEALELYHHDDTEEYDTFPEPQFKKGFLLFHGNAPKLRSVSFWGVHLDWDASLPFLQGLRDVELAYHANDVRPSFATFAKMLAASPDIETLSLLTSGPTKPTNLESEKDKDWPDRRNPIEIPSLKELVVCHHELDYILPLLPLLHTPNVVSLHLDFESGDCTELAMLLATPPAHTDRRTSLLSGLQQLKIGGLPCNTKGREAMLEQLVNLKLFNLNCCDEDEVEFFNLLKKLKPQAAKSETGPTVLYCPNLTSIYTTGIRGKQMKSFVEARRQGGVPLKRVGMSDDDEVDEREEKWLKDNVEEVEFFEPDSDFEDVYEVDEFTDSEDGESDMDEDEHSH
ncbi:hypothetical protein PM082_017453 [Marasmius tenuissimus]|nr:hypothetical protein PM082_017453 [Marasmius tenuissimus]